MSGGLNMHQLWMKGMPIKPPDRRRANSQDRCEVHAGSCTPLYLHEHFIYPQPLQVLALGEVKDNRKAWLCATGLDNVLAMVQWVVEADPHGLHFRDRIPWTHKPGDADPSEVAMAELGLRRHYAALSGLAELRANGPWAVHPNDWRCSDCGEGMTMTAAGGVLTWTHRCGGRSTTVNVPRPEATRP